MSKKIDPSERISKGWLGTGRKGMKRVRRPFLTIMARLANLHLLLRGTAFSRWPLSVTFFAPDVYEMWNQWCEKSDEKLRDGIDVLLDARAEDEMLPPSSSQQKKKWNSNPSGKGGVEGLDITDGRYDRHVQKSRDLLAGGGTVCGVCDKVLAADGADAAVCPHGFCEHVSHLKCLANAFLREDDDKTAVLPTGGRCPACKRQTKWVNIVKELALRTRTKLPTKDTKKGEAIDADADAYDEGDDLLREMVVADLCARDFGIPLSGDHYRDIQSIASLIYGDSDSDSAQEPAEKKKPGRPRKKTDTIADSEGETSDISTASSGSTARRSKGRNAAVKSSTAKKGKVTASKSKKIQLAAIEEATSSDWDEVETVL